MGHRDGPLGEKVTILEDKTKNERGRDMHWEKGANREDGEGNRDMGLLEIHREGGD